MLVRGVDGFFVPGHGVGRVRRGRSASSRIGSRSRRTPSTRRLRQAAVDRSRRATAARSSTSAGSTRRRASTCCCDAFERRAGRARARRLGHGDEAELRALADDRVRFTGALDRDERRRLVPPGGRLRAAVALGAVGDGAERGRRGRAPARRDRGRRRGARARRGRRQRLPRAASATSARSPTRCAGSPTTRRSAPRPARARASSSRG